MQNIFNQSVEYVKQGGKSKVGRTRSFDHACPFMSKQKRHRFNQGREEEHEGVSISIGLQIAPRFFVTRLTLCNLGIFVVENCPCFPAPHPLSISR
jgi:hypothetical protein